MPAATVPVRVATLNLLNNAHGRWADRERLVVDQARALDADVYAFQEVAADGDQLDRLLDGLGPAFVAVPMANPDPDSIKSLAVVTRLAVAEHDGCTDLEQGDIALRVRLETADGVAFSFVTTHFHYEASRAGSDCRRRQAEQVTAWLDRDPSPAPVVLTGDFNARPASPTVALLKRRFRSAHEVANGAEPVATHPTPLLRALDLEKAFGVPRFPEGVGACIDFVFVDPSIGVTRCAVAWNVPSDDEEHLYPSDHFGLVADLLVPQPVVP